MNYEQLKEIVNNAPTGSTHYAKYSDIQGVVYYMVSGYRVCYWNSLSVWSVPISNFEDIYLCNDVKKLSDIKRIVELSELLFKASEQIYDLPDLEQEIQNALDKSI